MGKLLSSLQLQTFLILWIIYIVNGAPYSKYGRTCKDIGCLPRETCVMAYDTCSFNQQEGTNCGRYPTCQKRTDMQTPQQNINTGPILLNPSPDNTRNTNTDYVAPRDPINQNNVIGWTSNPNIYPQIPFQSYPAMPNPNNSPYQPGQTPPPYIGFETRYPRTTANPIVFDDFFNRKQQRPSNPSPPSNPNDNIWNIKITTTTERTTTTTPRPTTSTTRWIPRTTTTSTTRRSWTTKSPFYNPSNPAYGGGGSYFGNRYGDDNNYGGGSSFTRTSTTKRPSSSGSGFFSGLSSFLSGDVGKLLQNALSGGGGGGSSGGGFFDTRPLIENKNRGSLFSENPSSGSGSGSSNTYMGYPVTRYGSENAAPSYSNPPTSSPTASHGNFGWKLS